MAVLTSNTVSFSLRQNQQKASPRLSWRSKLGIFLFNLGLSFAALPVMSAERVLINFGPLEFTISVGALQTYAEEGVLNSELQFFANYLSEEQLATLRGALLTRADLSPVAVSQFFYSPQGETILRQAGELIQTRAGQSGFYGLRAALILAAADEEGLTVLNVLRQFPTPAIRLNSSRGFELLNELTGTLQRTQRASQIIEQQSTAELIVGFPVDAFAELPDLRVAGSRRFVRRTLTLNDTRRNRIFPLDLYLPQGLAGQRAPTVVISHGLGSDRNTFGYLARHLASYGFAVAVLEHPGSNAAQIQSLLRGLEREVTPPRELIDRPLDISYLLDVLERSDYAAQLNLESVGMIGQSFGAYTALTLAGADINFEQLQQDCLPLRDALNLSLLLQCDALQLPPFLYNLRDERIQSVIAINPLTSSIFGEEQIQNIDVPVMMVASGADTVTPAISEQIRPFTWLTTPERYLVLLREGTHFSTLTEEEGVIPVPIQAIGPDPRVAQEYMQALSLAFFQSHIAQNPEYEAYLSALYAQVLSQEPIALFLVRSLDPALLP